MSFHVSVLHSIKEIPDQFRTQEICSETVRYRSAAFFLIRYRFKTEEIWIEAVEVDPWWLYYVPDHFKTEEICDDVVKKNLFI